MNRPLLFQITFRCIAQEKLSWFLSILLAIIKASCFFALMHIATASLAIIIFDLFTIFLDSILYGIIFARTKKHTSWSAHLLSVLEGLAFFIIIFY